MNQEFPTKKIVELMKVIDSLKDKRIKLYIYNNLHQWVVDHVSNKIQTEILEQKNKFKEISGNNIQPWVYRVCTVREVMVVAEFYRVHHLSRNRIPQTRIYYSR